MARAAGQEPSGTRMVVDVVVTAKGRPQGNCFHVRRTGDGQNGDRRTGTTDLSLYPLLPIRENSCYSWFQLKACVFREGWRIFNHE